MKQLWLILLMVTSTAAAETKLATYYEESGYTKTPGYVETIDYCKRLAGGSRWVNYTTFGKSPQGRDLPLLIANKNENFTHNRVRRKSQAVLLIQAGIHSGEIDGKDAGFMLLRDIAVDEKFPELLDRVTILFIPIFNVDGHERFGPYNRINQNGPEEMGWRVTAQTLNLNRDYLKVDSPEMRAWIELFNKWEPDFFVDCHVTNGADYQYELTYLVETLGNQAPALTEWTRQRYLASMKVSMMESGYEIFPYVYLLEWSNPRSGMKSWVSTPRFSTGYTALRNRPGLLIETHMLKDYKSRVSATYEMLKQTVELLGRERDSLRKAIKASEDFTKSHTFRAEPFAVSYDYDRDGREIEFKGFAYEKVESQLSGGTWFQFSDVPETFPVTYYDKNVATAAVDLPAAYLIPPEWTAVIERIELHGVETSRLKSSQTVPVSSYRFKNLSWRGDPYEGRHPVTYEVEAITESREFPAGTVVIKMDQKNARVAAHILEPEAPDSYVQWGFFDGIFEQKEYASSYVMETMAREMIARNPALKKELDSKKADDPDFARNPGAILNWFYSKTPYWDNRINVYPVGKVMNFGTLGTLKI
ncbi:MAG: M14 family metallopeptidase [bacterium]|nr:M14 family metallopeptidase [bacterium]